MKFIVVKERQVRSRSKDEIYYLKWKKDNKERNPRKQVEDQTSQKKLGWLCVQFLAMDGSRSLFEKILVQIRLFEPFCPKMILHFFEQVCVQFLITDASKVCSS